MDGIAGLMFAASRTQIPVLAGSGDAASQAAVAAAAILCTYFLFGGPDAPGRRTLELAASRLPRRAARRHGMRDDLPAVRPLHAAMESHIQPPPAGATILRDVDGADDSEMDAVPFDQALYEGDAIILEQDRDLRYTRLYNARKVTDISAIIGATDAEVFTEAAAEDLRTAKLEVLRGGERRKVEVCVPYGSDERWYRVSIAPRKKGAGVVSTMIDITDLKASENKLLLLMRELAHRTKNMMTVIDSIARQTARRHRDIDEFQAAFSQRLQGLAATHDLLIRNEWRPLELRELVTSQLEHGPAAHSADQRVEVGGPVVNVDGEAALHIGLALHELATNALKYGALSGSEGRVFVGWEFVTNGGSPTVRLTWQEIGGPPAVKPEREGFGTFLTTRSVESGVAGKVERDFAESGFRWQLTFSLSDSI